MRILALDLGSVTGVAYGDVGDPIQTSSWRMPTGGGAEIGYFAIVFEQRVEEALGALVPDAVVFEAPFLGPKLASNMDTARRLLGMPWSVERICYRRKIPCSEANLMTSRKSFTGKGNATKPEIRQWCGLRGMPYTNEHEADACSVWYYAAVCMAPNQVGVYDPIFRKAG